MFNIYKNAQGRSKLSFQVHKTTQYGRLGTINTNNGSFNTPGFFFCATSAALRLVTTQTALELGTQGVLCNTYHLMDQADTIEQLGGLHNFINWNGPIMSDSGGFQIFSLGHGNVVDEIKRKSRFKSMFSKGFTPKIINNSVIFKNMRNGSLETLSPAKAIQIQRKLNSDLIFVLDECTPFNVSKEYVYNSLQLTKHWAELSLEEFTFERSYEKQGLYGIVQGSIYPEFRHESIEHLNNLPFFGYGIGGSLGSNRLDMVQVLKECARHLLPNRPVHLLGIGKIQDILAAVPYNIDTFDCVHPTRIARHGAALVSRDQWVPTNQEYREHIILTNAQYKLDNQPIDSSCSCFTCTHHSKAYLHHLFHKKELLGIHLVSMHNIHFMNKFMEQVRFALQTDTWAELVNRWK